MILHQSSMIMTMFIEIGLYFYYGGRNRELSSSSKLRTDTDSLRRCDVKYCMQKKRKEFAK